MRLLFLAALYTAIAWPANAHGQSRYDNPSMHSELRLRFDANQAAVFVPVHFNGRRRDFIVDTGATVTAFDSLFLDELGPPLRSVNVHAADGSVHKSHVFKAPAARLGALALTDLSEVLCVDLWNCRAAFERNNLYGVLGMDVLRHWVVQFDFDRGELALLNAAPKDAGNSFELHVPSGARMPGVMLNVAGVGRQLFSVDTGASSQGSVDADVLARLLEHGKAVHIDTATYTIFSGTVSKRRMCLRCELALGNYRHRDLIFSESYDNTIGLDYLRRYLVTFDFPGKKLYVKPSARYSQSEPKYDSGLTIWYPNGAVTVETVKAGSPAEIAGLKGKDVIDEIDLVLAQSLSTREMLALLRRPGEHTLLIRRGDQALRIVLEMETPPVDNQVKCGEGK